MKLNDVMVAAGSRTSGGDSFLWKCYGENANYMEFRDVAGQGYSHCIYDTTDYTVFEIHIEIPGTEDCFRWLNPDYKQAFYTEASKYNVDPNFAWEKVNYTHVETEELILDYIEDIGERNYQNIPQKPLIMQAPGTLGGATITFLEDQMENFKVTLDVRHEFEVKATSMDDAVAIAKRWQETSKTSWGEGSDISWLDHYVVKESVERQSSIY